MTRWPTSDRQSVRGKLIFSFNWIPLMQNNLGKPKVAWNAASQANLQTTRSNENKVNNWAKTSDNWFKSGYFYPVFPVIGVWVERLWASLRARRVLFVLWSSNNNHRTGNKAACSAVGISKRLFSLSVLGLFCMKYKIGLSNKEHVYVKPNSFVALPERNMISASQTESLWTFSENKRTTLEENKNNRENRSASGQILRSLNKDDHSKFRC